MSSHTLNTPHANTHMATHECSYCLRVCASKAKLLIHERTHTGEKPHECTYCGKKFSVKGDLVTHERTHTSEKPCECSY